MLKYPMNFFNNTLTLIEPFFKPQKYLKGFFLTFIVFAFAYGFSFIVPLGGVVIAIILGIVIANIFNIKDEYQKGIKYCATIILGFAIALMGIDLNFSSLSQLGFKVIFAIISTMSIAIILSVLLAKYFNIPKKLALLLGCGNGVCGSAAISAVSPIIQANKQDIATSIGIVNLLGVIGLFIMPIIILSTASMFDNLDASILIGNTLQAVGQVSGAGFSINNEVGVTSTTIKMGRVLMLTPLLIVIIVLYANHQAKTIKNNIAIKNTKINTIFKSIKIPIFIIFFIIFSFISSLDLVSSQTKNIISNISSFALIFAMSGLALGIHFSHIKKNGIRALKLASVVFVVQICVTLAWIFV
jgi:uncharacterized integral membrane protein (TIGR00698 family)